MNGWNVLIAAHASGAMLALLLGTVMLVRSKGDRVHRRIGRIWMADMYWVVLSSFGITRLNPGHLSWIHGLSAWTFISLTMAWRAARMGDVRKHRGWAIGSYGGLLGAFAAAVAVPVRLIPRTAVHQPLIAAGAVGIVGLVGYVLVKASVVGVAGGIAGGSPDADPGPSAEPAAADLRKRPRVITLEGSPRGRWRRS